MLSHARNRMFCLIVQKKKQSLEQVKRVSIGTSFDGIRDQRIAVAFGVTPKNERYGRSAETSK